MRREILYLANLTAQFSILTRGVAELYVAQQNKY